MRYRPNGKLYRRRECLNFKVERLALQGAVGPQRDPSHPIKALPPAGAGHK